MFTIEFWNFTCMSLSVKVYLANEFDICIFFSQYQQRHQKTASVDSQQSSSSDQPITSDLTNSHSPSISTNHITSPSLSPLSSPCLARTLSGGADSLPVSLEKVIKIKKSRDPLGGFHTFEIWIHLKLRNGSIGFYWSHFLFDLGLTVEAVDKGANGCIVKGMNHSGAFSKDGRVQQGDYIVAINNESMRRITNAQARAIIRRASLQGLDVRYRAVTLQRILI